jgi:hypothetical protein
MKTAAPTKREVAHANKLRQSAIAGLNPLDRQVKPATRTSVPAVERLLSRIAERVAILNPLGQGVKIAAWAAAALEAIHTDDWLKSKGEVAFAAAHGDKEAVAMHGAAVTITTENIVRANSNWLPFFEERSLGDADYPVILPDTLGMAMTVSTIGQDGGNVTIQSQINDPTPLFVPLHMRSTSWIEYPLVDAYKGSGVKDLALAQFDVARDRAWSLDALLASYLIYGGANTRLVASFVTTGAMGDMDYFAHPRVNTANLPAGNFVTLSGNSQSSLFRKEAFDAIIKYIRSWGDDVMEGGNLRPVEILVASSHVTAFLSQVTLTTASNFVVDQIFEGGMVLSYGGYKWIVTGNNTLDPNNGVAYVRSDQPIGVFFDKPTLAKALVDETPSLVAQNKGRTCEIWCEGFAMPLHWRKRTFGVRYMTPT